MALRHSDESADHSRSDSELYLVIADAQETRITSPWSCLKVIDPSYPTVWCLLRFHPAQISEFLAAWIKEIFFSRCWSLKMIWHQVKWNCFWSFEGMWSGQLALNHTGEWLNWVTRQMSTDSLNQFSKLWLTFGATLVHVGYPICLCFWTVPPDYGPSLALLQLWKPYASLSQVFVLNIHLWPSSVPKSSLHLLLSDNP